MKDIELPRKVITGPGAIERVKDLAEELGLKGKALVVSDPTTEGIAGNAVKDALQADMHVVEGASDAESEKVTSKIGMRGISFVLGVGGGRTIDISKYASYKTGIPYISVPTAAAHDGIASPQASIKGEKPVSIRVHAPLGVVADTAIIGKAPYRLTASGCADAISNYTSVLDWKLAKKEKNEYFGDYAAVLAMLSAEIIMHRADEIKGDVSILIEALISSGVAIGIAGTSRPCSGAEHNFSHALDQICTKPALHGEQCGVGTIMMAHLHGAEWEKIRDALKKAGAPTTAKELGIEEKYVIEALTSAHKIRERYTILRDGLSEKEAVELARATGVIE